MSVEFEDFKAISLGRKLIYQSRINGERYSKIGDHVLDFFKWLKDADGRDEGLSEIDENSAIEFDKWFSSGRCGGHPWEVCRGGNSTHVSLYVRKNEKGYYLSLAGKAWNRSIETIKFYLAIRKTGAALFLHDAKGLKDRLLEDDYICIQKSRTQKNTVPPKQCGAASLRHRTVFLVDGQNLRDILPGGIRLHTAV